LIARCSQHDCNDYLYNMPVYYTHFKKESHLRQDSFGNNCPKCCTAYNSRKQQEFCKNAVSPLFIMTDYETTEALCPDCFHVSTFLLKATRYCESFQIYKKMVFNHTSRLKGMHHPKYGFV